MNKKHLDTTVVIIGAGPAGAGTSFFLSKYGVPHIIIDKEVFPRDKVCGDACSGKTALVINRANPEWLNEIIAAPGNFLPSWGITFIAPNGQPLDIPFSPHRTPETRPPGFTVSRLTFDNFLFGKIPSPCSTVFAGAVVVSMEKSTEGVTVVMRYQDTEYTIQSKVIVGADGDKSTVRKTFLSKNAAPKSNAVGLRAYYEGVTGLHPENFIELHFLPEVLPGYIWIFPLPNGVVNVGIGILSEKIRKKNINLREVMLKTIQTHPKIAPRFAQAQLKGKILGWGLPLGTERLPISGDNFILTGDAACLVDPFSGEGIGNALYSGMLAAAALRDAAAQGNYSGYFLKTAYDDVVYKRLGDELKLSTTLQRLCNYPWLFNFVVNKASKSRSLQETISCMFTDMNLREQLSKPSFYWKILRNK